MTNKQSRLFVWLFLAMLGMVQTAVAADFKDFSVIVNNQEGTLLTAEEQVEGTAINFGVAVAADGTVSRVAADDASAVATVSGKYHSDHGCTNLTVVVPVTGNVKISVGQCTYSVNDIVVKNSDGATVVQKTPGQACWKNDRSNVTELYYAGEATTLTISGMNYCPYVAVEATDFVPTKYAISYSLGSETAEGVVPAGEEVTGGDTYTIVKNFTLYKEGYTLTGWTDGAATYATGETITPASDLALTPVFTANTVSLADRNEAVDVTFTFRRDQGAPTVGYEGQTGIWVTQAVVNGTTVDIKADFSTSPGKFANANWTDWAQMNSGTRWTVPSCKGATVTIEAYSAPTTTTIDGQTDYETTGNTISKVIAGTTETIDVVIGDGSYYRYIKVNLPVVQSAGGQTYADEATSVVWALDDATTGVTTVTPIDAFSITAFDLGDNVTTDGTGTGQATYPDGTKVVMTKFAPKNGKEDAVTANVRPVAGLTFTPTKISTYIARFGTDVENGVTVTAIANGESVLLGNYTAPRNNQAQDVDKFGSNSNYTNQIVIELTEEQQAKLATTDIFSLSLTVGVGSGKQGGFGQLTIEGKVNGTIADVNKYVLNIEANPAEGGEVSIYPKADEYAENDEVTLTATENFGYDFVNWTDMTGNVVSTEAKFKYTVTADETLTANFKKVNTYALNLVVDGTNDYMVKIVPAPTVIDGKNMYEEGTAVQLTADQYEGLVTFTNWSDGETNSGKTVSMTGDIELTAYYTENDIIAGWDFYKSGGSGRKADFASEENDAAALNLVNTENPDDVQGWLDKSAEAAGGYESFAGAAVNWRVGSQAGDVGNYHWQTKLNAEVFTDINVQFQMLYNYNAYQTYDAEYSLDGEAWTKFGSLSMTAAKTPASFEGKLPEATNNQKDLYIRLIADKTSKIDGTSSANDGNALAMFFITGTPKLIDDGKAPALVSSVPAEDATGASATGKIVLTFDERVKLTNEAKAELCAVLPTDGASQGETIRLTPVVSGKTITFEYKGLEYSTEYGFILSAGSVADMTDNTLNEDIIIHFTTMTRPSVTKAFYDEVVGSVDELVTAINNANTRADKTTRYRIFVKKGTYKMPTGANKSYEQGSYPDPITYVSGSNISFIGEDRDATIITQDDEVNKTTFAGQYGTTSVYDGIGQSDVLQLSGSDYYFQDITIKSGIEDGRGRNLAIQDKGSKSVYKNVCLFGYQDTWTSNSNQGLYYFEGGVLRGRTDYLCGKGDAYFKDVDLMMTGTGGYLAVPSTPKNIGWVFKDCTIKSEKSETDGKYTLGRPWGSGTPVAVYIDTKMEAVPSAIGWNEMSGGWPKRFAEYNSTTANGTVIDLSGRKKIFAETHENNPILTAEEAVEYSNMGNMFGDWDPTLDTEQAPTPKNVTISGTTLTWDDSQYALLWAIVKNGQVVDFTNEPTYTVDDTSATYAVRAANEMGGLGEAAEASVATGIEEIVNKTADDAIYNIKGMPVKNATRGIYIIGGKKVVVK